MLAPELLPVWGGVGTYIVELVKHLPTDVNIHVVTPMREGFGNDKISPSYYDFSKYFGGNVKIHFICKASDTFIYNAKFQYACLKYVPKLIKEERVDLIHSHTAHMPDLLLMFRKVRKPVITTVHTTIKSQRLSTKASATQFGELERSEKATYIVYPALRLAEEVYFKRKRHYITPSNWMKIWLEDNFRINGNIRVIPNSVDVNDYESKTCGVLEGLIPEELKDRRMILYVGRLLAAKGLGTLVEAMPEILNGIGKGELLFVFAGPGDRGRYLNKLKKMKVECCYSFTGPLPREATIQLMMTAKVVVVPSFHENSPYVVLESMACGTPVVASHVGGIPEIVRDGYNGMLVEPGSPKLLVKAVTELLEDESNRSSIGQHARQTILSKFSWAANLNKYLDVYSEALN